MMSVMAGNQLLSFSTSRPRITMLGQSSIGNGTPLLGMICLATRIDPVSSPISGTSARFSGCVLKSGILMGLLSMQISVSFLMSRGSTTLGAIVAWLSTWWSTPGVLTISE